MSYKFGSHAQFLIDNLIVEDENSTEEINNDDQEIGKEEVDYNSNNFTSTTLSSVNHQDDDEQYYGSTLIHNASNASSASDNTNQNSIANEQLSAYITALQSQNGALFNVRSKLDLLVVSTIFPSLVFTLLKINAFHRSYALSLPILMYQRILIFPKSVPSSLSLLIFLCLYRHFMLRLFRFNLKKIFFLRHPSHHHHHRYRIMNKV